MMRKHLFSNINRVFFQPESSKSDVQKVTEGDDFQFECHDGNQTEDFEIYWVKNDSTARFRQNGSNLSLPNIQRTAAGEYICYSHNLTSEANASIVQVVRVNVLCKSNPW